MKHYIEVKSESKKVIDREKLTVNELEEKFNKEDILLSLRSGVSSVVLGAGAIFSEEQKQLLIIAAVFCGSEFVYSLLKHKRKVLKKED